MFYISEGETPMKTTRILTFLAVLFSPMLSSGFVIIDRNYVLSSPEATVNIAGQTCPGVGVTNDMLKEAVRISIEDFWNTVADSKLRLKMGDVVSRTTYAELVPGEILIGCSTTGGPGSNGGAAQADVAKGSSFILLDTDIMAAGFDRIVGVVVHEMGHSVGLSHSGDSASVMTYEAKGWGLRPSYLSQDDKNGVAYLYPTEGSSYGLIPGCSSQAHTLTSRTSMNEGRHLAGFLQELFFLIAIFFVAIASRKIFIRFTR
jgi:hypothetical protein